MKRQIHFNRRLESPGENIASWYFLVINDKREIIRIRERMVEQLSPIIETQEIDIGLIPDSHGLRYELFVYQSPVGTFDKLKIYHGKWKKDRELYPREKTSLLNLIKLRVFGK